MSCYEIPKCPRYKYSDTFLQNCMTSTVLDFQEAVMAKFLNGELAKGQ